MPGKFRSAGFIVLFAVLISVSIISGVEARKIRTDIVTESNVSDEIKDNIQLGIDTTFNFFKDTYNLELKQDIRNNELDNNTGK